MNFNAQGKGPLELPRLTSLGPMTETSQEIGQIVFRGSNIADFNNDEFLDNTIDGRSVNIWVLDSASVLKRYNLEHLAGNPFRQFSLSAENTDVEQALINEFRIGVEDINQFNVDTGVDWIPIESLQNNELIARKIEEDVTGGLSTRLGTGLRFAGTGGSGIERRVPLVLFLEKNRIPAELTKVEYNSQFINEHPEIAGAADKGSKMLMAPGVEKDFELGSFISRYGVGSRKSKVRQLKDLGNLRMDIDDDALLVQWFKDPLSSFNQLEPEQELFAHTRKIDLNHSLFGVGAYLTESRLDRVYEEISVNNQELSQKAKVEIVHDEVAQRMIANSERLVTIITSGVTNTGDRKIPRHKFVMLYDGEFFTEDYQQAVPFTDPDEF